MKRNKMFSGQGPLRLPPRRGGALLRGCPALRSLNCGGCPRLSSISTSLIADHAGRRIAKLGLGGCANLNDIDLEDIGRCAGLSWLSLCACHKVSDSGLKQIGLLAGRQAKAYAQWEEQHGRRVTSALAATAGDGGGARFF